MTDTMGVFQIIIISCIILIIPTILFIHEPTAIIFILYFYPFVAFIIYVMYKMAKLPPSSGPQ